jgi:hypothetical protein
MENEVRNEIAEAKDWTLENGDGFVFRQAESEVGMRSSTQNGKDGLHLGL